MKFFYGDDTPSPFTTNVLSLLEDVVQFAVQLLRTEEKIIAAKDRSYALEHAAVAEVAALDELIGQVTVFTELARKRRVDGIVRQLAADIDERMEQTRDAAQHRASTVLETELAVAQIDESVLRKECHRSLAALLGKGEIFGARRVVAVVLDLAGTYEIAESGELDAGLAWTFRGAVPKESCWASLLRVGALSPQLQIRTPQTRWFSRGVHPKLLRIDRYVVMELLVDGDSASFKLRPEPSSAEGFDFEVSPDRVLAVHVGTDDATGGPFDLTEQDGASIRALAHKLNAALTQIRRGELVEASFEGIEFSKLPTYQGVAGHLIEMLVPVVTAVAAHSRSPSELVLRHGLAGHHREEVFVSRKELRQRCSVLEPAHRALFHELGLDREPAPTFRDHVPAAALDPESNGQSRLLRAEHLVDVHGS